jgi:cytochrome c peroxidase
MNPITHSLRASARRAPLISARFPRQSFRSSFRRYSTEAPPPKSSNAALYTTIGLALLGGVGYYAYSSSDTAATSVKSGAQSAKSALKFTPSKADYQKVDRINCFSTTTPGLISRGQVYNKIANIIDEAGDYDGMSYCVSVHATLLPSSTSQMALTVPFCSVSPGTALVPSTRRLRPAAGTVVNLHDR